MKRYKDENNNSKNKHINRDYFIITNLKDNMNNTPKQKITTMIIMKKYKYTDRTHQPNFCTGLPSARGDPAEENSLQSPRNYHAKNSK